MTDTRKATQPFLFEGAAHARTGVLIVHGFTGSPAEMRPLGLHLHLAGYTVHGVLLSHHGGEPAQLRGSTYHDWVLSAREGLDRLWQRCDQVVIAGLSLGGLIALHLAASDGRRSDGERAVSGIVVMAAPASVADPRSKLVRFAKYIVRDFNPLDKIDFGDPAAQAEFRRRAPGVDVDFGDPRAVAELKRRAKVPLDAIDQLVRFNERVMKELPDVRAPALFMQGRRDSTVIADSAELLCARAGSAVKRVIWFEASGHVLTLEPEREAVFAEAQAFIAETTR